jgi:hypothetical protein
MSRVRIGRTIFAGDLYNTSALTDATTHSCFSSCCHVSVPYTLAIDAG